MSVNILDTARKRSLGQGNIFTSVCRSFCPPGGRGKCLPLGLGGVSASWLISIARLKFGFGLGYGFLSYVVFFHWFGFRLWSPDWNVCKRDRDLSLGWRSFPKMGTVTIWERDPNPKVPTDQGNQGIQGKFWRLFPVREIREKQVFSQNQGKKFQIRELFSKPFSNLFKPKIWEKCFLRLLNLRSCQEIALNEAVFA